MPLVRKPTGPSRASTPDTSGVLETLESGNAQERWTAARALADAPDSTAALAAALRKENDARVREALFTSLARIGTSQSADELLALLRSDDANLRTGALDALHLMIKAVRELLPRLLTDPDVDVRILSCELARRLPGDEATPLLGSLLEREQEMNVCAAAIDVLAEVGTPEALPALAACGQRFRNAPFLEFAIQIATDRIRAQPPRNRG
jgi:HEAT repeat protein